MTSASPGVTLGGPFRGQGGGVESVSDGGIDAGRRQAGPRSWRPALALALATAMLSLVAPALAEEEAPAPGGVSPERVRHEPARGPLTPPAVAIDHATRAGVDASTQRPIEMVRLLVGSAAFLPAYLFAWPFGAGPEVVELCLTQPAGRLFGTPLGDL